MSNQLHVKGEACRVDKGDKLALNSHGGPPETADSYK